jgi:hypothetical protein
VKFPSIRTVAAVLRLVNREPSTTEPGVEESFLDVRLQVYEDGSWSLRHGDPQYDLDHRGFWGAGSVPGDGRRFSSEDIARELIEQAKAHAADCEDP